MDFALIIGLGGVVLLFAVPRDPQEYAKTFVPRNKRK